jgi:hypothetical protein
MAKGPLIADDWVYRRHLSSDMDPRFLRTLGLTAAKTAIAKAWESQRFPHALLLHGAPGMGQAALALDTAQMLLCESRDIRPCERCGSCVGFKAQSLENLFTLLPLSKGGKSTKENKDGESDGLDAAAIDEIIERQQALYRDPYLFAWPERAAISIHQVRELQKRLAYAESRGRPRVVILTWLEALRPEAANALLKTLEEPPKDTYFIITSEDRAGLMPTLISRCLLVTLPPLSTGDLGAALQGWKQRLPDGPKMALVPLAEGAPGNYLALHETGELRLEAASRFLAAAFDLDFNALAEHVETAEAFSDMEGSAGVLELILRLIRFEQHYRVNSPSEKSHSGGHLDSELQAALAPLRKVQRLEPFTTYIEDALAAVRNFTKPQNAVLGLFLEYENKAAEAEKAA